MATPSSYIAISRRSLDVEDYIDLARRHAGWIVGPTLAGLVIATVVALSLQNVYVSQAVMRITPSQISDNIVSSTINEHLTERIQQMQQEILSRLSLSNIIQDPRLDLYKAERAKAPIEDVIETMKNRDIKINIVDLPTGDRRGASAFTISFQYPDSHKAQQVVQTLITKFVEANQTSQRDRQQVVSSFVHDELADSRAHLVALDEQLTRFRVENSGKLPEEAQMNIAQLTAAQQQANTVNDALNRLDQQKVQIDTHLETLQQQLNLLTLFEKDSEPTAAVAVQNERLQLLGREVTNTESQLAQLRQVYKPNYPDIRDAENRLSELRRQRDELQKQQDAEDAKPVETKAKKTNYQQVQSAGAIQGQIDATKAQAKSLEMERANRQADQQKLNREIAAFQSRLSATSAIEARYGDLVREEKAATEKLQSEQKKEELNEEQGQLLQRKAGEQLEVLDTPSLPEKPSKPNRLMVVGAGLAISFMIGLAMAGVQEARDTSLKNLKDVRAYTNLPVLSSIPLLENSILVRRKRRVTYLAWSAGVIIGIICIGVAFYYHLTTTA